MEVFRAGLTFNHITQGLVQLNSKCCLSLMGNLCSRALLSQWGASSLYLIVTGLPATLNCCLSTLQSLHLKWACFLYNPFTAKLCWWLTFSLSSGPFCRAAPHVMFLNGVIPSQEPEFWFIFVALCEVTVDPFLCPLQASFNESAAL